MDQFKLVRRGCAVTLILFCNKRIKEFIPILVKEHAVNRTGINDVINSNGLQRAII